jgi:hypothetical protein
MPAALTALLALVLLAAALTALTFPAGAPGCTRVDSPAGIHTLIVVRNCAAL